MKSIAVYNLKGGVGKTTTVVNLAYLASLQKNTTLLWDWDPQAAATWFLANGVQNTKRSIKLLKKSVPVGELEIATPYPRLNLIPADLSLRKAEQSLGDEKNPNKLLDQLIQPLSEQASYLFHDCPPTLSPHIEYILTTADLVLVPIIPSPMSIRAIEQVTRFFESKKRAPKKIIGFFNQVDMRRKIHKNTIAEASKLPVNMLKTCVPYDSAAEQMSDHQKPLLAYTQQGRACTAYKNLWKEIKRELK